MTEDGPLKLSGRWCIPKFLLWIRLGLAHRGAKVFIRVVKTYFIDLNSGSQKTNSFSCFCSSLKTIKFFFKVTSWTEESLQLNRLSNVLQLAALSNKFVQKELSLCNSHFFLRSSDFFRWNGWDKKTRHSLDQSLSELKEHVVSSRTLDWPIRVFTTDWIGVELR